MARSHPLEELRENLKQRERISVNSAPDVAVSPNSISNEEKIQLEIVRGIAAYVQALQLLLKWVNCQARILNRNDVLNPPRNVARNACV